MKTRLLRPAAAVLLVVFTGALGGGCGLATDRAPETMSRDNLPEDLGGTSVSTSMPEAPETTPATFWFLEAGDEPGLRRTSRRVPLNASVKVVLETLLTGPTEQQTDVTTAVPDDITLPEDLNLEPDEDGVLVLDLPEEFYNATSPREAFAQVVLTMTELPGVRAIQFQFEGEDRPATNGNSRQVSRPVGYADYAELIGDRASEQ